MQFFHFRLKKFEFLTDECVSDHNERIRSIQIDKNFITQTFRMYSFIISRTVKNRKISLRSETHSSVKNSNYFNHESAE